MDNVTGSTNAYTNMTNGVGYRRNDTNGNTRSTNSSGKLLLKRNRTMSHQLNGAYSAKSRYKSTRTLNLTILNLRMGYRRNATLYGNTTRRANRYIKVTLNNRIIRRRERNDPIRARRSRSLPRTTCGDTRRSTIGIYSYVRYGTRAVTRRENSKSSSPRHRSGNSTTNSRQRGRRLTKVQSRLFVLLLRPYYGYSNTSSKRGTKNMITKDERGSQSPRRIKSVRTKDNKRMQMRRHYAGNRALRLQRTGLFKNNMNRRRKRGMRRTITREMRSVMNTTNITRRTSNGRRKSGTLCSANNDRRTRAKNGRYHGSTSRNVRRTLLFLKNFNTTNNITIVIRDTTQNGIARNTRDIMRVNGLLASSRRVLSTKLSRNRSTINLFRRVNIYLTLILRFRTRTNRTINGKRSVTLTTGVLSSGTHGAVVFADRG